MMIELMLFPLCFEFPQRILVVADATEALIKIRFSNEMKSNENSYLLRDAANSIEKIEDMAEQPMHQITQIILINEYYLWILLSNGNFYEYGFSTKRYSLIEDTERISYCSML